MKSLPLLAILLIAVGCSHSSRSAPAPVPAARPLEILALPWSGPALVTGGTVDGQLLRDGALVSSLRAIATTPQEIATLIPEVEAAAHIAVFADGTAELRSDIEVLPPLAVDTDAVLDAFAIAITDGLQTLLSDAWRWFPKTLPTADIDFDLDALGVDVQQLLTAVASAQAQTRRRFALVLAHDPGWLERPPFVFDWLGVVRDEDMPGVYAQTLDARAASVEDATRHAFALPLLRELGSDPDVQALVDALIQVQERWNLVARTLAAANTAFLRGVPLEPLSVPALTRGVRTGESVFLSLRRRYRSLLPADRQRTDDLLASAIAGWDRLEVSLGSLRAAGSTDVRVRLPALDDVTQAIEGEGGVAAANLRFEMLDPGTPPVSWSVLPDLFGLELMFESTEPTTTRVRLHYESARFANSSEDFEFLVHDFSGRYRITIATGSCGFPVLSIASDYGHPAFPSLSIVVQDFAGVGSYDLTDDTCAFAADETRYAFSVGSPRIGIGAIVSHRYPGTSGTLDITRLDPNGVIEASWNGLGWSSTTGTFHQGSGSLTWYVEDP